MAERSIHCAGCRVDLVERLEFTKLPECRHLFCENCYYKEFNSSTECFTCPLDWTSSYSPNRLFPTFQENSLRWKNTRNSENKRECDQFYEAMLRCLNFTLYPCLQEVNHSGFSTCPFDHSLHIAALTPTLQTKNYCEGCKAFTRDSLCPRCNEPTHQRNRPSRIDSQKIYSPELSQRIVKNPKFKSLE